MLSHIENALTLTSSTGGEFRNGHCEWTTEVKFVLLHVRLPWGFPSCSRWERSSRCRVTGSRFSLPLFRTARGIYSISLNRSFPLLARLDCSVALRGVRCGVGPPATWKWTFQCITLQTATVNHSLYHVTMMDAVGNYSVGGCVYPTVPQSHHFPISDIWPNFQDDVLSTPPSSWWYGRIGAVNCRMDGHQRC